MSRKSLVRLRILSLLLLLPGMAGLIYSALLSNHYAETLPTLPDPQSLHMTPRTIDGKVVYQTDEEDKRLRASEFTSVSVFVLGLALGLIYLEKWSELRSQESDVETQELAS